MQDRPPISPRTCRLLLDRFRNSYLWLVLLFSVPIILAIAWLWNQPSSSYRGFPYSSSIPILIGAAIVINPISFYFQQRYVRSLLQRPDIAREFRVIPFAFRFYLYNLATAIGLSIVSFYPLLITLFFFWIYPIIFWLVPYHLAIGLILGRGIQRDIGESVEGTRRGNI